MTALAHNNPEYARIETVVSGVILATASPDQSDDRIGRPFVGYSNQNLLLFD